MHEFLESLEPLLEEFEYIRSYEAQSPNDFTIDDLIELAEYDQLMIIGLKR